MAAAKKTKIDHRTGTIRAKLESVYKKAKGDMTKAREAALKAGLNKHTAHCQLWLISKGR